MRVRIYPEGGAGFPFEFTGNIAEELPDGLAGEADWSDEVVPLVDSEEPAFHDYGNATTALSFTVTRSHENESDAGLFYLDHPGEVPRIGRIEFLIVNAAGEVQAKRYLNKARIKVRLGGWKVCETTHHYDIVGGIIRSY